jgi:chromate transporter
MNDDQKKNLEITAMAIGQHLAFASNYVATLRGFQKHTRESAAILELTGHFIATVTRAMWEALILKLSHCSDNGRKAIGFPRLFKQLKAYLPEPHAFIRAQVKPVIIAVVVQAIWGLVKPAMKTRFLMGLGVIALVLSMLGMDEVLLLFGAGALAGIMRWAMPPAEMPRPAAVGVLGLVLVAAAMVLLPTALTHYWSASASGADTGQGLPFGLTPLFLFFLKVGSVLYGSGYVLLAFLRDGLVTQWHWLTEAQLLDATAVGQVTPGPVFTTATFIGYVLGGPWAALVATLGIFLPSFVFVAVSGPLVPRLRRSPLAGAFLDGVNVAALALMLAVTWQLARAALVDAVTVGLAVVSAVLLVRYRVNSVWLIVGAALLGILASAMGWSAR